ncbi:unnamed protein product [Linum trigynum]|uniref:Uncharacterized protein n=1 Tax=Linum trigynum TaxID=586398 RepID=A0AAV2EAC3_9ROSI
MNSVGYDPKIDRRNKVQGFSSRDKDSSDAVMQHPKRGQQRGYRHNMVGGWQHTGELMKFFSILKGKQFQLRGIIQSFSNSRDMKRIRQIIERESEQMAKNNGREGTRGKAG